MRKSVNFGGDPVPDTDSGSLFNFAQHCRTERFRFISISHSIHVRFLRNSALTRNVYNTFWMRSGEHLDHDQSGNLDSDPGWVVVEEANVQWVGCTRRWRRHAYNPGTILSSFDYCHCSVCSHVSWLRQRVIETKSTCRQRAILLVRCFRSVAVLWCCFLGNSSCCSWSRSVCIRVVVCVQIELTLKVHTRRMHESNVKLSNRPDYLLTIFKTCIIV